MRNAIIVGLICFVCLLLTAATIINGARDFVELASGGTPAGGNVRLWAKTTDHSLYATARQVRAPGLVAAEASTW